MFTMDKEYAMLVREFLFETIYVTFSMKVKINANYLFLKECNILFFNRYVSVES